MELRILVYNGVTGDAYCLCHAFLSTFSSVDNMPLASSQSSFLSSDSEQQKTSPVENRFGVSLDCNLKVTPCGTLSNSASVFVDTYAHLGHFSLLFTLNIFFKHCNAIVTPLPTICVAFFLKLTQKCTP